MPSLRAGPALLKRSTSRVDAEMRLPISDFAYHESATRPFAQCLSCLLHRQSKHFHFSCRAAEADIERPIRGAISVKSPRPLLYVLRATSCRLRLSAAL